MASSAGTPQGSVRQRHAPGAGSGSGSGKLKKEGSTVSAAASDAELDKLVKHNKAAAGAAAGSERDYKVTFGFITVLAFVTRFWGISHPDEVVFDEVHFGKVCPSLGKAEGGRRNEHGRR